MVSTCCVPYCYTFQLKDRNLKFHRFPRSPIRKQKWIEAIFNNKDFEPLNGSLVCEKHFRKFDYIESIHGTKILAGTAVPSVFCKENKFTEKKEILEETPDFHNSLDSAAIIKNIRKDNFQEICRCCVINKGEVNVFEAQFHNVTLADLIYFCSKERVLYCDGLPNLICIVCKQQIINSFTFINKVRDNQVHLRKLHQIFSSKYQKQSSETNFSNGSINNNIAPIEIVINNSESQSSSAAHFKEKYKGLTKVYNQLCEILLKNKSQINRRAKRNQQKRKIQLTECVSGEIAQEQEIISIVPAVCDEEDLLSTEVSQVKLVAQEEMSIPHENYDEDQKGALHDKGIELSPVLKNEFDLPESYRETVDDNLVNCQISCTPEDEVKANADKVVQSNFVGIETINNIQLKEKDDAENEQMKASSGTQCFDCPEVFHTEVGIIRHCRLTGHNMTDRFKCKLCSSTFRLQRRYRMHLQQHKERKCICEICGASVFSNNLKRHLEVHTDMRIHVCPICGRTYAQKGTLDYHIKYQHFGERNKSLCFICGKSFRTSSVFNKHLNDEHVDDDLANKSYQCEICQKFFVSKVSLTFHQKFSHAENPVERARYDRNGKIMSVHQKRTTLKRSPSNKQPKLKFCSICLKSMKPSGYKIHMLMHKDIKPFECKICKKIFRQYWNLKSHMNIHLNRKPFKCKHCLKCFRQKISLINHIKRHTGERPYRCPVCEEKFITLRAMKIHHQIHLK